MPSIFKMLGALLVASSSLSVAHASSIFPVPDAQYGHSMTNVLISDLEKAYFAVTDIPAANFIPTPVAPSARYMGVVPSTSTIPSEVNGLNSPAVFSNLSAVVNDLVFKVAIYPPDVAQMIANIIKSTLPLNEMFYASLATLVGEVEYGAAQLLNITSSTNWVEVDNYLYKTYAQDALEQALANLFVSIPANYGSLQAMRPSIFGWMEEQGPRIWEVSQLWYDNILDDQIHNTGPLALAFWNKMLPLFINTAETEQSQLPARVSASFNLAYAAAQSFRPSNFLGVNGIVQTAAKQTLSVGLPVSLNMTLTSLDESVRSARAIGTWLPSFLVDSQTQIASKWTNVVLPALLASEEAQAALANAVWDANKPSANENIQIALDATIAASKLATFDVYELVLKISLELAQFSVAVMTSHLPATIQPTISRLLTDAAAHAPWVMDTAWDLALSQAGPVGLALWLEGVPLARTAFEDQIEKSFARTRTVFDWGFAAIAPLRPSAYLGEGGFVSTAAASAWDLSFALGTNVTLETLLEVKKTVVAAGKWAPAWVSNVQRETGEKWNAAIIPAIIVTSSSMTSAASDIWEAVKPSLHPEWSTAVDVTVQAATTVAWDSYNIGSDIVMEGSRFAATHIKKQVPLVAVPFAQRIISDVFSNASWAMDEAWEVSVKDGNVRAIAASLTAEIENVIAHGTPVQRVTQTAILVAEVVVPFLSNITAQLAEDTSTAYKLYAGPVNATAFQIRDLLVNISGAAWAQSLLAFNVYQDDVATLILDTTAQLSSNGATGGLPILTWAFDVANQAIAVALGNINPALSSLYTTAPDYLTSYLRLVVAGIENSNSFVTNFARVATSTPGDFLKMATPHYVLKYLESVAAYYTPPPGAPSHEEAKKMAAEWTVPYDSTQKHYKNQEEYERLLDYNTRFAQAAMRSFVLFTHTVTLLTPGNYNSNTPVDNNSLVSWTQKLFYAVTVLLTIVAASMMVIAWAVLFRGAKSAPSEREEEETVSSGNKEKARLVVPRGRV